MPAVQGTWWHCLKGLVYFLLFFFFFKLSSRLLTKGRIDPSQPRALHTVTAVRSQGKPGTVFSGAG